jgi:hypothetical protein
MPEKIVKVIDLVPGVVHPLPVARATSLGEHQFWREFVLNHTPVIIRGAVAEWPAVSNWKRLGYLESLCGDEQVPVARTFNPVPSDSHFESMIRRSLAECINEISKASADATYSIPAMPVPQRWETELGKFSFLGKRFEKPPLVYPNKRMFVYRNAASEWHYHHIDETITSQLVGSKKISLFRLTQENWRQFSRPIEANLHHTPCGKQFFPQESSIAKYEGVIEAGDAVYIPPFWWHGIDPADTEPGVTLAHCFRSPLSRFGDWKEPITRNLIKEIALSQNHKRQLLPLLARIAFSSLNRKIAKEEWWPLKREVSGA